MEVTPLQKEEYIFEGEFTQLERNFVYDNEDIYLPEEYFLNVKSIFQNFFISENDLMGKYSSSFFRARGIIKYIIEKKAISSKKTGKNYLIVNFAFETTNEKEILYCTQFSSLEDGSTDFNEHEESLNKRRILYVNGFFKKEDDEEKKVFNPYPYLSVTKIEKTEDFLQLKKIQNPFPSHCIRTNMGSYDGIKNPEDWIAFAELNQIKKLAFSDYDGVHSFPLLEKAYDKNQKGPEENRIEKLAYGVTLKYYDPSMVENEDPFCHKYYHVKIYPTNQSSLLNLFSEISSSSIHSDDGAIILNISQIEFLKKNGCVIVCPAINSETADIFFSYDTHQSPEERLKKIDDIFDFFEVSPISQYMRYLSKFFINKKETKKVEKQDLVIALNKIVKKFFDKIIFANNPRYFFNSEKKYRDFMLFSEKRADIDGMDCHFPTLDFVREQISVFSEDELNLFDKVMENANKFFSMFNSKIEIVKKDLFLPKISQIEDTNKFLIDETKKGIVSRYGDDWFKKFPKEINDRLKFEIDSINKKYSVVYIASKMAIDKSKELGFSVGSRGSVGSSAVAFFSGVSEVNPLPPHWVCKKCKFSDFSVPPGVRVGFDLPDRDCPKCGEVLAKDGWAIEFSTFMGFDGSKVADIDLNFSGTVRDKVMDYISNELFPHRSYRAGTVLTLQISGQLKRAINLFGANYALAYDFAINSCGVKKTTGKHAGGLVIVPSDMSPFEFSPICKDKKGVLSTHFEFNILHDSLLKMDLLGADSITLIEQLSKTTGVNHTSIDWYSEDSLNIYKAKDTWGINEFTTENAIKMLEVIEPQNWRHLCSLSGLQHGTGVWAGNAREIITSGQATIDEIDGCRDEIVETLTKLLQDGKKAFDIVESVRKGKGVPAANKTELLEKIPQWYFNYLNKIEYMFPKAHAAAYTIISSKQAWYKKNFYGHFVAAYLSVNSSYVDANWFFYKSADLESVMQKYKKEAMDHSSPNVVTKKKKYSSIKLLIEAMGRGISFSLPHINFSLSTDFSFDDGIIYCPLITISGAGPSLCEKIVLDRKEKGKFEGIVDFFVRVKPKKDFLYSLNNFNNFEKWDEDKKELCLKKTKEYEKILKRKAAINKKIDSGQKVWFFVYQQCG